MSSVVEALLLSFLMVIVVPLQLSKMVAFIFLQTAGCGKRLCQGEWEVGIFALAVLHEV